MGKARRLPGENYTCEAYGFMGSTTSGHGKSVDRAREYQYVLSQGNPYRNIGRGSDVGGPFLSQKVEISGLEEPLWLDSSPNWYRQYTGVYPSAFIANVATASHTGASYESIAAACSSYAPAVIQDNTLDSRGATAISRTKPTNPVFDGATAIAELISERKLFSIPGRNGSVSGEYLNYQLGIAPAAGAVSDLTKAMENSEKILEQLRRDSGRRIRRQYQFEPVTDTTHEVQENVYPRTDVAGISYLMSPGTLSTITRTETTMWFSGAFTFHVPKELGMARSVYELDRLYGIKPGVDTAWELIPFSFVADYFSNAGDVLSNLNALSADGLVMQYGYMMAKQVKSVTSTWKGRLMINGSWQDRVVGATVVASTLQRRKANPFGFGILDEDLSTRQLSILAALGLNRR